MPSFTQLLVDVKYADLCSSRLERWKKKSTRPYLVNFRCPLCGDSKKNRLKARGFLYEEDNEVRFKCWNGCPGRKLRTFLEAVHPLVVKEYVLESYKESNGTRTSSPKSFSSRSSGDENQGTRNEVEEGSGRGWAENCLYKLKSIDELRLDHPVRQYVDSRQLPVEAYQLLRYCPAFIKFTNRLVPGKLDPSKGDEPRLLIPFINRQGKFFGYQGRGFSKDGMRYISIMLDSSETKVFGMDRIDFNKTIYVLEGAIDSFFLPNAIATIQGDLTGADSLLKGRRCVYIPDRDIRNPQIVRLVNKLIVQNKTVCLLPPDFPGKDLNEARMAGKSVTEIENCVRSHTYSGLQLRLEFGKWKKI